MPNKFSVVMLVSRTGKSFYDALNSVLQYEPDEFQVYLDTKKLIERYGIDHYISQVGSMIDHLKDHNATVSDFVYPKPDHHENIVHNYHRAILEARYEWIIKADDDDLLIGRDRHELLDSLSLDDVGLVYGDKIVKRPNTPEYLRRTRQVSDYHQIRLGYYGGIVIFSGTVIFRKEAFARVHPLIDHGYFYDWKTWYWILRSGWKCKYVSEPLFYQHANVNPSVERRKHWGRFPDYFDEMERIPDEILEYVLDDETPRTWDYHLSFVYP